MIAFAKVVAGVAALLPVALLLFMPFAPDAVFIEGWYVLGALTWLVTIPFVVVAWRTAFVPVEKRSLWMALLVFGNVVVLPFFWYWYIRPQQSDVASGRGRA